MPIDAPLALFSNEEVQDFLVEDGYKPGTQSFIDERARRYYRHGDGWAERSDWKGDRKKAT